MYHFTTVWTQILLNMWCLITTSMLLLTLSWVYVSASRSPRYSIFWPLEPLCSDKCKENGKPFGRLLGTTCSCYSPMMFIPADNNPCDDTVGPSCQRYCQYQGYRGGSCPYNGICFCFCKAKDRFPPPPPPNAVSVLTGLPLATASPPPDGSAVAAAPATVNLTAFLGALSPLSNVTSLLTDTLGHLIVIGAGGGGGVVAATNATPAAVPDLGENDPTNPATDAGTAAIGAAGAGAGGGIDTGASDTAGADGSSGSQDTIASSGTPPAVATGGTGTGSPAATPGTVVTGAGAAAASAPAPIDTGAAPAAAPVNTAATAGTAPAGSAPTPTSAPAAAAAPVTPVATSAADGSSGSPETVSQSGPPAAAAAVPAVPVPDTGSSSAGLANAGPVVPTSPVADASSAGLTLPTPAVPAAPVASPLVDIGNAVSAITAAAPAAAAVASPVAAAPVADLGSAVSAIAAAVPAAVASIGSALPVLGSAAPVVTPVLSREPPTPPLDIEGGVSETVFGIGSQLNLGFGTKDKWSRPTAVSTSNSAFWRKPGMSKHSGSPNTEFLHFQPLSSKDKLSGHNNSFGSSHQKPNRLSSSFHGIHSKESQTNQTNITPVSEKHSFTSNFLLQIPNSISSFGSQTPIRKPALANIVTLHPKPYEAHSGEAVNNTTKVNSFVHYAALGNFYPLSSWNVNSTSTETMPSKTSYQPHPLSSKVPHSGFGSKPSPWIAASQSFPHNSTKSDSSFTSSVLHQNNVKFGSKPSPWTAASKHFDHNATASDSQFTDSNRFPSAGASEPKPSPWNAGSQDSNSNPCPSAGASAPKPSPWIEASHASSANPFPIVLDQEPKPSPWNTASQDSNSDPFPKVGASAPMPLRPWIEASQTSITNSFPNAGTPDSRPSPWNTASQPSTQNGTKFSDFSFTGSNLVPNAGTSGASIVQAHNPQPPVDLAQYFNGTQHAGFDQDKILSIINGNVAGLVPGSKANVSNPNAPVSTVIMSLGNYSVAVPINGADSSDSNSWSNTWSWSYNSAMEKVAGIQKQVTKLQKYAVKALNGFINFLNYTALDSQ